VRSCGRRSGQPPCWLSRGWRETGRDAPVLGTARSKKTLMVLTGPALSPRRTVGCLLCFVQCAVSEPRPPGASRSVSRAVRGSRQKVNLGGLGGVVECLREVPSGWLSASAPRRPLEAKEGSARSGAQARATPSDLLLSSRRHPDGTSRRHPRHLHPSGKIVA
jgi:hypothetical protein